MKDDRKAKSTQNPLIVEKIPQKHPKKCKISKKIPGNNEQVQGDKPNCQKTFSVLILLLKSLRKFN